MINLGLTATSLTQLGFIELHGFLGLRGLGKPLELETQMDIDMDTETVWESLQEMQKAEPL